MPVSNWLFQENVSITTISWKIKIISIPPICQMLPMFVSRLCKNILELSHQFNIKTIASAIRYISHTDRYLIDLLPCYHYQYWYTVSQIPLLTLVLSHTITADTFSHRRTSAKQKDKRCCWCCYRWWWWCHNCCCCCFCQTKMLNKILYNVDKVLLLGRIQSLLMSVNALSSPLKMFYGYVCAFKQLLLLSSSVLRQRHNISRSFVFVGSEHSLPEIFFILYSTGIFPTVD